MKRIIILIALCVFNASGCFSQNNKMSQEDFKNLVDYMNVEISKAYIEYRITDATKWTNYKKDSTAYFEKVKKSLESNSVAQPVLYEKLQEILKDGKHWTETCNSVTIPYNELKQEYPKGLSNNDLINKLFERKIATNASQSVKDHPATKNKYQDWKNTIEEEYKVNHTRPVNPKHSSVDSSINAINKRLAVLTAKVEKLSDVKNSYFPYLAIIAVLLCVALYFYLRSRKHCCPEESEGSGDNAEMLQSKIFELEQKLNKMTADYSSIVNKYDELEKSYSDLVAKINKVDERKQNNQPVNPQPNPYVNPQPNPQMIKKAVSKSFYMSIPNADGSFWDRNSRQELDPTASCYKFVELSPGIAEFHTVDNPTFFQQALQNPYDTIEPVCEPQNAWTNERKRIITESPGKAQKNGEKWNVTLKAKIRYE